MDDTVAANYQEPDATRETALGPLTRGGSPAGHAPRDHSNANPAGHSVMSEQRNLSNGRSDAAVLHRACCEQRPDTSSASNFNVEVDARTSLGEASVNAVRDDDCSNDAETSRSDQLVPPEDTFRIRNLSEHHRRKYLKTQNVALVPPTSQIRFRSSFQELSLIHI